jgi:uncharacterized membrane protein YccC
MGKIGKAELIFSVNTFLAAMLALYISFAAGLDRPFWAMLTVYITSQPLVGAVRSKAVYRLCGTIVGAAMTVVIVPTFVNEPIVLTGVLSLWVGACLFISLLDRTARSYLFMLAGYTSALIGFPAVNAPAAIFTTAVLRVEEIGLGICCAALLHSLIFPRTVRAAVIAKLAAINSDLDRWWNDIIIGDQVAVELADRHRLAVDITDLHLVASHLPYDVDAAPHARAVTLAIEHRLVLLLPLLSAIDDRVTQIRRLDVLPPDLVPLMTDIQLWLRDTERESGRTDELKQRCDALQRAAGHSTWAGMLTSNLSVRLVELIGTFTSVRTLTDHLRSSPLRIDPEVRIVLAERAQRHLHQDYGLAFRSALSAILAISGCCVFWIMTAWPSGSVAAMIAGVICCFFATFDDPRPGQKGFLIWTLLSFPLAALYLFAILPQVTTFETLVIALAAALIPLGMCMAVPAWYGRLMPLTVGFIGALALNNTFAADFASFANSNLAELIGAGAALIASGLVRAVGAEAAILRMMRRSWRELAVLADGNRVPSTSRWVSLAVDRAGLVASRVARLTPSHDYSTFDSLRGVRRGINILQLRAAAKLAGAQESVALEPVLREIAAYYRRLIRNGPAMPPPSLLAAIDSSLVTISASTGHSGEHAALDSLVGLRRSLFPTAARPQLAEPCGFNVVVSPLVV